MPCSFVTCWWDMVQCLSSMIRVPLITFLLLYSLLFLVSWTLIFLSPLQPSNLSLSLTHTHTRTHARTHTHTHTQGQTGHRENRDNSRWPGSQFGPLPYFFFFFFLFLPAECLLKWLFPNSPFNNTTPINHESASLLGWQRDSPRARSAHPKRMRDSRME